MEVGSNENKLPDDNAPNHSGECPWTIATSVLALTFGLIGVLWAMIPCLGWTSLLVSVPASIAGFVSVTRAGKLNLPKTFPVAGLTIALCGVLIAFLNFILFTIILGWSL